MNKTRRVITAGIVAALSLTATAGAATAAPTNFPVTNQSTNVTKDYIVTYAQGISEEKKATVAKGKGLGLKKTFKNVINGSVVAATPAQAALLAKTPGVVKVEEDIAIQSFETTQSNVTWGLDRADQRDLPLTGGYKYSETGLGVKTYILDTGIKTGHTEFTGRTAAGFTAFADGRGTDDCNGHGTHVASTVAGTTYGVAKKATVVPVRVLDCNGSGQLSGILSGIDWTINNHAAGTPAVANMSLGAGGNTTIDNATKALIADGVTVVAAAGNSSVNAGGVSPARVPEVLTVAATDKTDTQSSFSNFGSAVDVYAPGSSILGASHTSTTATVTMSGTSMAAPHTAGAAALLLEKNKALTPAQVQSAIVANSTANKVKSATTGTPNRLLFTSPVITQSTVAKAPSAATNVKAVAGSKSASISWTKGASNGAIINKQVITIYSGTTRIGTVTFDGNPSSVRITGLTAGKAYTFAITEYNSVGASPMSAKSNIVKPTA